MQWFYELSWLWKAIGIAALFIAIGEMGAYLIAKGMKKHLTVLCILLVALIALAVAAALIFKMAQTPMMIEAG